MKKTKGYVSIYTLIIFMLLVSIITVLILGIRMESKKVINKGDYYQNKLIARSIYYKIINDENFTEFAKNPSEQKLNQIQIDDTGLDCYNEKINLKPGKNDRGFLINYNIKYKDTITKNTIVIEKNKSELLSKYSTIKLSDDEIEKIIDNNLEKIGDDLVFYQDGETLYYLQRDEYEKLLNEIIESLEDNLIEGTEDEEVEPNEEIEIDIKEYLDRFKVLDGDYFYTLKSFEVLSVDMPQLKGIGVLEEEGEKVGRIKLDGILINYSPYSDIRVLGKVVEVQKYEGRATLSIDNIFRLNEYIGLNLNPKVHSLMIK